MDGGSSLLGGEAADTGRILTGGWGTEIEGRGDAANASTMVLIVSHWRWNPLGRWSHLLNGYIRCSRGFQGTGPFPWLSRAQDCGGRLELSLITATATATATATEGLLPDAVFWQISGRWWLGTDWPGRI
ncbi:hypothetical protein VNO78_14141 [Psophocarpus tetragonolobus]|uniref:Uncharacterized protein n=1 Tax=Psophocarpus tetragonolobus TaxID=3891 RepID=A0AAN9SR36_PSOTE